MVLSGIKGYSHSLQTVREICETKYGKENGSVS